MFFQGTTPSGATTNNIFGAYKSATKKETGIIR